MSFVVMPVVQCIESFFRLTYNVNSFDNLSSQRNSELERSSGNCWWKRYWQLTDWMLV